MAKKRAAVRLDDYRFPNSDVFSVRLENEAENGFVGKLGDVEANNRDVRKLETPAAGDSLVLIANPALNYDESRLAGLETNYYMEAGDAVRAYGLKPTMKFAITKEAIEGTHTVGEYLVAGAGHKLVPSATVPATGFAAKVVREEPVGGALSINVTNDPTVYVVLDIVQN